MSNQPPLNLAALLGTLFQGFDFESLFRNSPIPPSARTHLRRVYTLLALATLSYALGVGAEVSTGWFDGLLVRLGTLGGSVALAYTPRTPTMQTRRMALLFGVAAGMGISSAGVVAIALAINPSVLIQASVAALLGFLCFSLSALTAPRRSWFFLGSILSTVFSTLMWLRISMMWGYFNSRGMHDLTLWVGLFGFLGFILVDTQRIVERAASARGKHDVVADPIDDSMNLFVNLVSVFMRILILLLQRQDGQAARRRRQEEERRRKRGGER